MCYRKGFYRGWGSHQHHHSKRPHHAKRWAKQEVSSDWNYPPVNVQELADRYELYMYAAGYEKTDFSILVSENALIISVDEKENDDQDLFNWRRYEFRSDKFQRRFELDEKVDKEAIKAEYKDGILTVILPKLEGFETFSQEIEIA